MSQFFTRSPWQTIKMWWFELTDREPVITFKSNGTGQCVEMEMGGSLVPEEKVWTAPEKVLMLKLENMAVHCGSVLGVLSPEEEEIFNDLVDQKLVKLRSPAGVKIIQLTQDVWEVAHKARYESATIHLNAVLKGIEDDLP